MGLSQAEIRERVAEAAGFVGLSPDLMDKSPFELSGGQKRRVAIAGVMAMRPDILVLDEPTAGLDPRGRNDILAQVAEYRRKTGSTVLLVSHSMEDIARMADRVLVISEGRPFCYGTVDEVFSKVGELSKMGLALPQITRICYNLSERGFAVSPHVFTVEAAKAEILRVLSGGGAPDAR
jgi:energy-coupling factor transport system ATP-binding protein